MKNIFNFIFYNWRIKKGSMTKKNIVPSKPVKRLHWPIACLRNISTPPTVVAPAASASFNNLVLLGVYTASKTNQ